MKNLIRHILKEESLRQNLKQQVKDFGWRDTYSLVGDEENLAELAYDNNPMEFIDSLGLKRSESYSTYFSNHEGRVFLDIFPNIQMVEVHHEISEFLFNGFKLDRNGARQVIKDWLFDRHNIEIKFLAKIYV